MSNAIPLEFGDASNGVVEGHYDRNYIGAIDEVHISNVALSNDWIKTEYNNQNSPGTFYTIGSQTSR
jgi:hypothetical protein